MPRSERGEAAIYMRREGTKVRSPTSRCSDGGVLNFMNHESISHPVELSGWDVFTYRG
jgi:hypothetical protein